MSVVDTKSLRSTKTDTTFSTSLLGADLKSVKDVKPVTATQKQAKQKDHGTTDNGQQTTDNKSKTQSAKSAESTKSADDSAAKR